MQHKPEAVARYYDEWTQRYLTSFGTCIQAHRPASDEAFLGYLARRIGLSRNTRALDAGCGVCGPARYFASQTGAFIEGLTISPVQARMARELDRDAELADRIRVSVGDFHDLGGIYGSESFDVVYFLESLSHSADSARVIRSVFEVLKPGGAIYIKDFFIRPCEDEACQRNVLEVISVVDELFETRTAWAGDIIESLESTGFVRQFVEHPQFSVDNSRWQDFERTHGIKLFGDKEPFDWSEWLEMRYQKPVLRA